MNSECKIKFDISNLRLTDKATNEIKHPSQGLSLRERQFFRLFFSDTGFCSNNIGHNQLYCEVCEGLIAKVDFVSLVDRGYLTFKSQNPQDTDSHTTDSHAEGIGQDHNPIQSCQSSHSPHSIVGSEATHNKAEADDVTPAVFLRVASGNF